MTFSPSLVRVDDRRSRRRVPVRYRSVMATTWMLGSAIGPARRKRRSRSRSEYFSSFPGGADSLRIGNHEGVTEMRVGVVEADGITGPRARAHDGGESDR